MKVISLILADREIARVEEGVFRQLVEEQNYFCYSKPKLRLTAEHFRYM